ncbi:MAG: B12-binding domain-containing radical SAM protein, partial [Nitrospirae bacterium]|nr:B12-binding domain-containing radical SAM protein [Nitrospirota bacterium]
PDLAGEAFFDYAREEIRKTDALLFGLTSLCSNYPLTLRLASLIKETVPGARVVLGGPQASAVFARTLEKHPAIDYVVVGEGEQTLCDLVEGLHAGRDLAAIPGLAFRREGKVVFTGKRPLLEDLDRLPLPDWDLVDLTAYRNEEYEDYIEIEAGRGCPLRCTFCATSPMWERTYRVKSPERILREMRLLHERTGVTRFGLVHDNLAARPQRLRRFCEEFLAHGTPFQWTCSATVNSMSPETLDLMHASGCRGIFLGIETGSPRVQRLIRKHVRLERVDGIIRHAHALGIRTDTAFIMGFPEEAREDLDDSLKMALICRKAGVERVFFSLFAPLVGAPIYEGYRERLVARRGECTLAILPFAFHGVEEIVQEDSGLFSPFYRIPNPLLDDLPLVDLNTFMDEMIDWYTVAYDNLLEVTHALGLSPLGLFEQWHAWFLSRGHAAVQSGEVFYTFPEFLEWYEQEVLTDIGQAA